MVKEKVSVGLGLAMTNCFQGLKPLFAASAICIHGGVFLKAHALALQFIYYKPVPILVGMET